MTDHILLQDDRRGAVIHGEYRFRLHRKWDPSKPVLAWVMLNPSTADETKDDQTVTKCINYAKRWGYGKIVVGNLFALRSKHPSALVDHPDPIAAPENDAWLHRIVDEADDVAVAWGNGGMLHSRGRTVAAELDADLVALGTTQDGHPWHPARKPGDLDPVPFSYEDGGPA